MGTVREFFENHEWIQGALDRFDDDGNLVGACLLGAWRAQIGYGLEGDAKLQIEMDRSHVDEFGFEISFKNDIEAQSLADMSDSVAFIDEWSIERGLYRETFKPHPLQLHLALEFEDENADEVRTPNAKVHA